MAEAINQNNIADICKSFVTSMKTVNDLKLDIIKQSMATFSNSAEYIIKFYKISSSITDTIVESSAKLNENSIKAQSAITDSIGKIIGTINTVVGMKLPNMISSEIKFLRLRYQINQLMNIFVGNGGVISQLKVLSYVGGKHTINRYDKNGNLIKTDTVEGVDFKKTFETFKEMVDSILEMIDSTEKIYKGAIKSEALRRVAIGALLGDPERNRDGLFGVYIKLIQSPEFKQIGYKQTGEYTQKASDNISLFSELIKTITDVAGTKNFVSLLLYRKLILPEIVAIISELSSVFKDDKGNALTFDDGIKEKLEQSLTYITSINSIITIASELEKYKIHPKKINKIFSEVELILTAISNFSQSIKSKKYAGIKPQIATIKSIIDSMLGLVGDIIKLGLALIPLALATPLALGTLWVIGGFIKVAVHVINWISIKNDYETTAKAVGNITKIIGLMLLMVGVVLAELILISLSLPILIKSAGLTLITFAVIAAITYGIAWLAVCINMVLERADTMWEGLLFMAGLIGVMLLVTGMLILFAYLATDFFANGKWLMALAMFGVVAVVTVAVAGIGYLLTVMLPGIMTFAAAAVSLVMAIGALILVGVELKLLAEFSFSEQEKDKIKENSRNIIDAAFSTIDAIFGNKKKQEKDKNSESSRFGNFIRSIFRGPAMIVELILSSMILVMTFISVTLLLLTAAELTLLDNINLNPEAINTNVSIVIGTAFSIISMVCGKTPPDAVGVKEEKKGLFGSLFKFLGNAVRGLKGIVEGILSFGFVAMTFLTIGMITLIAKNLKYLEGIEINKDAVETKVQAVIGTANSLINHIKGSNVEKSDIKKAELTKKFMKQIKKTVEYMSKIGEMNNQGQFDKAIDSYVRFVDKVNTVKVENIEKTAKMFEKMAEFSKSIHGNFEGLADTLNDKITPLLEKIDATLKNTESSLADTNKTLQDTGDKVSGISAVTGADAMVKTTMDKDGKNITAVDPKGLVNAINEIGVSISEIRKTISKFDRTIIADGLDQAVKTVNKPTS